MFQDPAGTIAAMADHHDIKCVAGILVGGSGTRMGCPKTSLVLPDGRQLVEYVFETVRRHNDWIEDVVILGHCPTLPASLAHLTILTDAVSGAGPLAGLCSLLGHAAPGFGLLLACDMPYLNSELLERLHASAGVDTDAVAFRRADRPGAYHACCALYHPGLLPVAKDELMHGKRSLQHLLAGAKVAAIDPGPDDDRMLTNLNHPEDYQRLFEPA